jgi:hypothetical protein
MSAWNVYVLNDDAGGFVCVLRDIHSEVHRTLRFASQKNAKYEMLCWLNENAMGSRVHWHARAKSDYDACHLEASPRTKVTVV